MKNLEVKADHTTVRDLHAYEQVEEKICVLQ